MALSQESLQRIRALATPPAAYLAVIDKFRDIAALLTQEIPKSEFGLAWRGHHSFQMKNRHQEHEEVLFTLQIEPETGFPVQVGTERTANTMEELEDAVVEVLGTNGVQNKIRMMRALA